MGKVRLYNTVWKLVTEVNLNRFHSDRAQLAKHLLTLQFQCNHTFIAAQHICKTEEIHLRHIFEEMNEFDLQYFAQKQNSTRRVRRGLVNMVGNAMKTLFGTLDETDALKYQEHFQELYQQSAMHTHIAEEQITFIKSAIDQFNQSFAQQREDLKYIIEVTENAWNDKTKVHVFLNEYVQYIFMSLTALQMKQKLIVDAITTSENNPNSASLLPPKVFYQELQNILKILSAKNLDLPVSLKEDSLAKLYQISKAEAAIVNGNLIICFYMPLVETEFYDIFHISSYPFRVKGTLFNFIVPSSNYILLDKFKDKYISMSESELAECSQLEMNQLICKRTAPIMYSSETQICEVILLREHYISDICDSRVSNMSRELWQQMKVPNSFIYTIPIQQQIIIACGGKTYQKAIVGSGILSIEPSCQVKSDSMILVAFQFITTTSFTEIRPSVQIYPQLEEIVNKTTTDLEIILPVMNFPNILNNGEDRKLIEISESIKNLKDRQHLAALGLTPTSIKSDIHWVFISLIIILILIIIIKVRICKKKMNKYRRRNEKNISTYVSPPGIDSPIIIRPPAEHVHTVPSCGTQTSNINPPPKPILRNNPQIKPIFEKNKVIFIDYPKPPPKSNSHILDEPNEN